LNLYGTIASSGDNSMAGPRGGKEKEERRKKKKGRKKKERGRRKEEGRRKGGGGEGKRRKKGGKKGEKKKKWGALLTLYMVLVHSKKMYLSVCTRNSFNTAMLALILMRTHTDKYPTAAAVTPSLPVRF
jgi:hypothetical protein